MGKSSNFRCSTIRLAKLPILNHFFQSVQNRVRFIKRKLRGENTCGLHTLSCSSINLDKKKPYRFEVDRFGMAYVASTIFFTSLNKVQKEFTISIFRWTSFQFLQWRND
jgi:hypothetical protein